MKTPYPTFALTTMVAVLLLSQDVSAWSPLSRPKSPAPAPIRNLLGWNRRSDSASSESLRRLASSAEEEPVEKVTVAPSDSGTQAMESDKKELSLSPRPTSPSPPPLSSSSRGPSMKDLMLAMNTNPRRLAVGTLSATGIALAGNFLGVTSRLLTLWPEESLETTGIDTYFPRGDFKRCRTIEYTFVIPKEWIADTFVELAKAQRRIQPLDYSIRKGISSSVTLPDSAYGPPGRLNSKGVSEAGDTNVSVIVASGLQGFKLAEALGPPRQAAEKLLSTSIAPEGSGRVATLLGAEEVERDANMYYKFEYVVDRGARGPPLRNIAVISASPNGSNLYTLTVVAPATKWDEPRTTTQLRKIADSFHLRTGA